MNSAANRPSFSIVTISYNQAAFLERTIRSVLEQDYAPLQYIVVDGGSTDGSVDIVNRYRSRLDSVLLGPDSGPADGLNKGFAQATGEWLGFLNSDDTFLPGALQIVAAYVRRHPRAEFVSGHCWVTDANDRVLRKSYSDPFSVRRLAYDACILIQAATFFRRSLLEKAGGFNVQNRIAWDSELFLQFGMMGAKHGLIDEFLATYRLHPESITGANRVAASRGAIQDAYLRRYLGRELRPRDRHLRKICRYWRKLLNPRDTWQRVVGGPIGGRFAKE